MHDTVTDTPTDPATDTLHELVGELVDATGNVVITRAEVAELLSFVREVRPLLAQLAGFGEQLKAGGLAGIAAGLFRTK